MSAGTGRPASYAALVAETSIACQGVRSVKSFNTRPSPQAYTSAVVPLASSVAFSAESDIVFSLTIYPFFSLLQSRDALGPVRLCIARCLQAWRVAPHQHDRAHPLWICSRVTQRHDAAPRVPEQVDLLDPHRCKQVYEPAVARIWTSLEPTQPFVQDHHQYSGCQHNQRECREGSAQNGEREVEHVVQ